MGLLAARLRLHAALCVGAPLPRVPSAAAASGAALLWVIEALAHCARNDDACAAQLVSLLPVLLDRAAVAAGAAAPGGGGGCDGGMHIPMGGAGVGAGDGVCGVGAAALHALASYVAVACAPPIGICIPPSQPPPPPGAAARPSAGAAAWSVLRASAAARAALGDLVIDAVLRPAAAAAPLAACLRYLTAAAARAGGGGDSAAARVSQCRDWLLGLLRLCCAAAAAAPSRCAELAAAYTAPCEAAGGALCALLRARAAVELGAYAEVRCGRGAPRDSARGCSVLA